MSGADVAAAERGTALVVALVAVTLVVLAALAAGGLLDSRRLASRLDERDVRLAALSDAAMARTLAELAADGDYGGLPETPFGGGAISSEVVRLGPTRARVQAHGLLTEWRVRIDAEVTLGTVPSVISWRREISSSGE